MTTPALFSLPWQSQTDPERIVPLRRSPVPAIRRPDPRGGAGMGGRGMSEAGGTRQEGGKIMTQGPRRIGLVTNGAGGWRLWTAEDADERDQVFGDAMLRLDRALGPYRNA